MKTMNFQPGPPEIYFRKPELKRQRVVARRRQNSQQVKRLKDSTIGAWIFDFLRRTWFPLRRGPVGGAR
jgi:hypothetical protein